MQTWPHGPIESRSTRPYKDRNNFSLQYRPKNLPFDILTFFRSYYYVELEGKSEPEMKQYLADNMFHFTDDLNISQLKVGVWDLIYCLFLPDSSFATRNFLQTMMGN